MKRKTFVGIVIPVLCAFITGIFMMWSNKQTATITSTGHDSPVVSGDGQRGLNTRLYRALDQSIQKIRVAALISLQTQFIYRRGTGFVQ